MGCSKALRVSKAFGMHMMLASWAVHCQVFSGDQKVGTVVKALPTLVMRRLCRLRPAIIF